MHRFFFLAVFGICLFQAPVLHAQYSHEMNLDAPVDINGKNLAQAWEGGINNALFAPFDFDFDGDLDLAIYDKYSEKLLTYINLGTPNTMDYTYAPEFEDNFPDNISSLILSYDFNQDSIMDLFTYKSASMIAFRGYKNTDGEIAFKKISGELKADDGFGLSPIYMSSVDFPSLVDINGDGDMDILNFEIFGSYINYFENLAVEITGGPDTLIFELQTECWGDFSEGGICNRLTLDDSCMGMLTSPPTRHAGSSLLHFDEDGDGDLDLLLADAGCSNLNLLKNDGLSIDGHILSQDSMFPSYETPVEMVEFISLARFDLNNDGKKDLIMSTLEILDQVDYGNVKLLLETASSGATQFETFGDSIFVGDMIDFGSKSRPATFDYNGDGLQDIVVGVESMRSITGARRRGLALLENVGTASAPAFKLVDTNYAFLDSAQWFNLSPCFGDIDGDGDMDMLIGNSTGTLIYKENIGSASMADFSGPTQTNWMGINDGAYSTPQLFDVNGDGLLDLVIGENLGTLNYYRNNGTATSPTFFIVSHNWGNVDVRQSGFSTGFSVPFLDTDTNGLVLYVGSESGTLFKFGEIDSNEVTGTFPLITDNPFNYFSGNRSTPALADFNGDGISDALIGNWRGGLNLFTSTGGTGTQAPLPLLHFSLSPNPGQNLVRIRGNALGTARLEIISSDGKRLMQFSKGNIPAKLSLEEFPKGIYLFHFSDHGASSTLSFVKQ